MGAIAVFIKQVVLQWDWLPSNAEVSIFAVVATGRIRVPADALLTVALPSLGLGESLLYKLVWCRFLHFLHWNFDEHWDTLWWPKQLKDKFSSPGQFVPSVLLECDGCWPLQKAQTGLFSCLYIWTVLVSNTKGSCASWGTVEICHLVSSFKDLYLLQTGFCQLFKSPCHTGLFPS